MFLRSKNQPHPEILLRSSTINTFPTSCHTEYQLISNEINFLYEFFCPDFCQEELFLHTDGSFLLKDHLFLLYRDINFVPWEINFFPPHFISTFCILVVVLLLHMKWALHRKGGKPAVQKSVKKVPRRQKSGQFIQKFLFFPTITWFFPAIP